MTDLRQFRHGDASTLRVTQFSDSGISCAVHVYRAGARYSGRLRSLAPRKAPGADKASACTRVRDVCAVALSLLALIVRRFRGASLLREGIERSAKERKARPARGRRAGKA